MARGFYVNGEASVAGNTGAGLEEIGISVDGVTITVNEYTDGIPTDTFGPHIFGEYQYMGSDGTVTAELIYFDEDVIEGWLSGLPGGDENSFGTLGSVGELMVAGDNTGELLIRCTPQPSGLSGNVTGCYKFSNCFLIDAQPTKLGTVRSTWTLTWKWFAEYQPSSSRGAVQFTDACS
jgi:hypothetical protein